MRFQRNQESQRVAYVVFLSGNWRTQWQSVHFTSRPAKFNSGLWSRRKHNSGALLFMNMPPAPELHYGAKTAQYQIVFGQVLASKAMMS